MSYRFHQICKGEILDLKLGKYGLSFKTKTKAKNKQTQNKTKYKTNKTKTKTKLHPMEPQMM